MKKKILSTLVAGLAALSLSHHASAEWQFGLGLPFALDAGEIGISAEGGYRYVAEPHQAFAGPELLYLTIEDDGVFKGIPIDVEADVLAIFGNGRYYFSLDPDGRFQLYAGGGLGFADADVTVTAFGDKFEESSTEFAFHVGAGADFGITETVFATVGYRYMRINDISVIGNEIGDVSDHILQAGVNFKF